MDDHDPKKLNKIYWNQTITKKLFALSPRPLQIQISVFFPSSRCVLLWERVYRK